MQHSLEILNQANKQPFLQHELEVLQHVERQVPGSVTYTITRFKKQNGWNVDDMAEVFYHYDENDVKDSYIQLRFCVSGNVYCRQKQAECDFCQLNNVKTCVEKFDSVDVLKFTFSHNYLQQFARATKNPTTLVEEMLTFTQTSTLSQLLPLCGKTRLAIDALLNHNYTDTRENIFLNAQTQILLLYSFDCMLGEKTPQVFQCKFLENEADREKIIKAREILLQHIGEPITIKALSRKVAINECYLKKGFKEIFGTTIFDFYQNQRMEHAKYLLYDKGLSVTEVSMLLGYSSISHFSTAFKKHTGIKPCELLVH